jgi:hypothetical protein
MTLAALAGTVTVLGAMSMIRPSDKRRRTS